MKRLSLLHRVHSRIATSLVSPALLMFLLLCLSSFARAQSRIASSGREFYIALPALGSTSNHVFRVTITATNACVVTFRFTENDSAVVQGLGAGARWELVIPRNRSLLDANEYRTRRSFYITSTEPVTVHALSDADALTDGYNALPTSSLGFDYYAVCYPTPEAAFAFGSVIAVIATQDGTVISIIPTETTLSGRSPGLSYGITLARGEVYQILSKNIGGTDLTGTRIRSNKPVVVLSGHRGGTVPEGVGGAANAMIEEMTPTVDWGRTFHTTSLAEQPRGYYRVTASRAGTEVMVNGERIATLGAGESHDFVRAGPITIETSFPVIVMQFTTHFPSNRGEPNGDPSMMILNPTDSYSESFYWTSPSIQARRYPTVDTIAVPFAHYLLVTAPVALRSSVTLDGLPVLLPTSYPNAPYASGIVKIGAGPHRLNAPGPVNAQIFGYSEYDAYSMPAGMRLRDPFRAEPVLSRTCQSLLDTAIMLSNFGGEQINVTGISFSPGIDGNVISPDFLPFSIAPGSTQSLRLRIQSLPFGRTIGTLTMMTSTSGARPLEIPIELFRDSIAIAILDTGISFPPSISTAPTRDTIIAVVNTGSGPAQITAPLLSGPFTIVSPSLPRTISPGDTLYLTLRFAPQGPGRFDGRLTLRPSPCGDEAAIPLHGERLRPAAIDASVGVAEPLLCPEPSYRDIPVTIRNRGEEPLRIDSITIGGSEPFDFTFPLSPNGAVVNGGDSVTLLLRFTPQGIGLRSAMLRIWNRVSPGGFHFLPVEGRKDSVSLTASVGSLDFGTVRGCDGEVRRVVTITNRGNLPARVDSVRTGLRDFIPSDIGPFDLAPGASRDVEIRFVATATGARHDTLSISGAPCELKMSIDLKGMAQGTGLTTDIDTLDFGLIPLCASPLTRMIQLTNSGATSDTITSLVLIGSGFSSDSLSGGELLPGASRGIPISFSANTPGDYVGELVVRAVPCGIERHVVLRGSMRAVTISPIASIDFGPVPGGGTLRRTTSIHNSGGIPLRVDTLLFSPNSAGLLVVSPLFPFWLEPGESRDVEIEYSGSDAGGFETRGEFIVDTPCLLRPAFTLRGEGSKIITLELWLPDTSASVDSRIILPIMSRSDRSYDGEVEITGEIRWERTTLGIDTLTPALPGAELTVTLDSIAGETRILRFHYRGRLPEAGTVIHLHGLVLLGAVDFTRLDIDSPAVIALAPATSFVARGSDGSLRITGICQIGGGRFIRMVEPPSGFKLSPNPAGNSLTVECRIETPSSFEVRLIDMFGREVAQVKEETAAAGEHHVEIDLQVLPQGLYWCEVRGGGVSLREKVIIRR